MTARDAAGAPPAEARAGGPGLGHASGADDNAAGHAHTHQEGHSHGRADHLRELGRRRLVIVLVLTAVFMIVEFAGGYIANSLALMADAGHMLNDVAALGLSAFALHIARRPPNRAKSYGYLRMEILAALVNGVTLVVIALAIFWQAWRRFQSPQPVESGLMLAVAAGGLVVNLIAAYLLHGTSGHNLNVRGAYLHVLGDLLGSVAALAAAVIIMTTGWLAADPLISCIVAALILAGSWRLIRESVDVLLEATPRGIDLAAVQRAVAGVPGVESVSDLHVWTLTSGVNAMSGHAQIADLGDYRRILDDIHHRMHEDFGISHVTVQLDLRSVYTIAARN